LLLDCKFGTTAQSVHSLIYIYGCWLHRMGGPLGNGSCWPKSACPYFSCRACFRAE